MQLKTLRGAAFFFSSLILKNTSEHFNTVEKH